MKVLTLLPALVAVLIASTGTPFSDPTTTAIQRLRFGMKRDTVSAIMNPVAIESGDVYWLWVVRDYFALTHDRQVWVGSVSFTAVARRLRRSAALSPKGFGAVTPSSVRMSKEWKQHFRTY